MYGDIRFTIFFENSFTGSNAQFSAIKISPIPTIILANRTAQLGGGGSCVELSGNVHP